MFYSHSRRPTKENHLPEHHLSVVINVVIGFFPLIDEPKCAPRCWLLCFLMEGATRRSAGLSLHRKFTLHEMQAKRCHQIRTDFPLWHGPTRPRGDAPVALCSTGRHHGRICSCPRHDKRWQAALPARVQGARHTTTRDLSKLARGGTLGVASASRY